MLCGGTPISLSLIYAIKKCCDPIADIHAYEASHRGAVYRYLKRNVGNLTESEYFDSVKTGQYHNGIQCQNLQKLTYADCSFDLCTSTEVLEHVADDGEAFRELARVLRPRGRFLFTVPLADAEETITRAVEESGLVRHLLEPQFHGDRIRGTGKVLVFRDYGRDITNRLKKNGFANAWLLRPDLDWLGHVRTVVVAEK